MKNSNKKTRKSEYYDIQDVQDGLYVKGKDGYIFNHLMEYIESPENIKLAYRNIKANQGSHTQGTDNKTIEFFAHMDEDEYVSYIQSKMRNYHPKAVRRKEIPKPNGKFRPLGIPCIEDRLVQQCILQILEPICESKFYDSSYGFRPTRSVENAIKECENRIQLSHMQYVVDVDIKGFFDNVNHRKLMRQLWTLGIRDTRLLQIIKQVLKAPIKMPNGKIEHPTKGTPQGGILSPLLANVVLNELGWWIDSQWKGFCQKMEYPMKEQFNKNGQRRLSNEYRALRKSNLKEMYIVRYADDFKIFCQSRSDAIKIKSAVEDFINHRLKLEISEEKTGITNLKKKYCEFLGFKLKMMSKGKKHVVDARMTNKVVQRTSTNLKNQLKLIQQPKDQTELYERINKYNITVIGIHNYYGIANNVCKDLGRIQRNIDNVMLNRLNITKQGEIKQRVIKQRYGKSKQVRWLQGIPVVPIGYLKSRNPMAKKAGVNIYSLDGRREFLNITWVDMQILHYLMRNPVKGRSVEYNDNRISLYSAQKGKCAITGDELQVGKMHCHHKKPIHLGGDDKYKNLVFITDEVHRLVHAKETNTIATYLDGLNLDKKKLEKLNKLRVMAGLEIIKQ